MIDYGKIQQRVWGVKSSVLKTPTEWDPAKSEAWIPEMGKLGFMEVGRGEIVWMGGNSGGDNAVGVYIVIRWDEDREVFKFQSQTRSPNISWDDEDAADRAPWSRPEDLLGAGTPVEAANAAKARVKLAIMAGMSWL